MFIEIRAKIRVLDKKIDNVDEKLKASIQNTNEKISGMVWRSAWRVDACFFCYRVFQRIGGKHNK